MLTEGSYEARIARVIRRHLEKRFRWISFDAVMVVLRTGPRGEESIHVSVVYDENGETLDRRWLSRVRNRMRRELRDLGADTMVTTSYIDRSSWRPCWTWWRRRRRRTRAVNCWCPRSTGRSAWGPAPSAMIW